MRRFFIVAIFATFFVLSGLCFADDDVAQDVYSVNIKNETGSPITTIIPTITIRPDVDKVWGYDCMTLAEGSENTETFIGIFDGTDAILSGECFGEDEVGVGWASRDRWPRGRKVVNGVVVRQGARTDVQIYFIRK